MKKLLLSAMVCFASLNTMTNASAGIFVTTQVAPGSSTGQFAPGDTVVANIFMQLTDTSNLALYNFSVQYDANELSFVSRSEFAFSNLSELDTRNTGVVGLQSIFDGSVPLTPGAQGPTAPFGPTRVASLVFSVLNPVGDASDIDIRPGLTDTNNDFFFDNSGAELNSSVSFSGASITAVPEPSSMMALATAAGIGTYLRKRRKVKVANSSKA